MPLKIFDGPDGSAPQRSKFADDLVGRFRSGYQANNRPVALSEWRVTTGDPDVADRVQALLGGEDPAEWEAAGEDNLEVFTKSEGVDVILEGKSPLRQRMILWGRNGKIIRESDGEVCTDGSPDPQAGQTLSERKEAAREGTGAEPQVEVYFRLAEDPDLGVFKFQSGSWSLVSDLAYNGVEEEITEILEAGGKVLANLSLEQVEFTAKSGPRAGKTVSYTKPVLKVVGSA